MVPAISTVATALTVLLTYSQWQEAKHQNELTVEHSRLARKSELEQRRAILTISSVKLARPLKRGDAPSLIVAVTNVGQTTARRVTELYTNIVGDPEFLRTLRMDVHEFDFMAPRRDSFWGRDVEPSVTRTFEEFRYPDFVRLRNVLQDWDALLTGTKSVWFLGMLDYETDAGTYRLRFCVTPRTLGSLELVDCGRWNWSERLDAVSPDSAVGLSR